MLTLTTPPKFPCSKLRRAYLERAKSLPNEDQDRKQALIHSAENLLRISLELEAKGHKLPD